MKEQALTSVHCFLCDNNKYKKLFFTDGFWIVSCRNCGIVITLDKSFNRASKSNLTIYSDNDYVTGYLSNETQKMLSDRARQRLQEIRKLSKGDKILDVGCSFGTFMKIVQEMGWQVEGVEPCFKTISYLRENTNLKVHQGTLDEVKLNKEFDVISYWDVLEHTVNPVKELICAKRHLKKEGILALQVPNFGSLYARIAKERFGWLCPADHFNHFTPKTLTLTLEKAGFKTLTIKTHSGGKSHFLVLFDYIFHPKKTPRPIRFIFLKFGVFLDRFFPFIGEFFAFLQSLFLLNGLIVVYAKKD